MSSADLAWGLGTRFLLSRRVRSGRASAWPRWRPRWRPPWRRARRRPTTGGGSRRSTRASRRDGGTRCVARLRGCGARLCGRPRDARLLSARRTGSGRSGLPCRGGGGGGRHRPERFSWHGRPALDAAPAGRLAPTPPLVGSRGEEGDPRRVAGEGGEPRETRHESGGVSTASTRLSTRLAATGGGTTRRIRPRRLVRTAPSADDHRGRGRKAPRPPLGHPSTRPPRKRVPHGRATAHRAHGRHRQRLRRDGRPARAAAQNGGRQRASARGGPDRPGPPRADAR